MQDRTPAGTGSTTGEAPRGMVSLAAVGLVLVWSAVCALWIRSLLLRRRGIAVLGLLLNGAPWAYTLWFLFS